MISHFPAQLNVEMGSGLAATNAMTVAGIKSGDNLLAVFSIHNTTGVCLGRAVSDFTVGNGTLTAATIDLSSTKFMAIWTSAPAA